MMKSSEFQEFKDLIKQNRAIETKKENNQRSNGGSDTIKEENEGIKNTSDLDKCPKCEVVYYCNSICQKKAWDAYHLQECAYIRKLHPKYYKGYWFKNKNFAWWQCNAIVPPSGILDIIRFMARIILKLNLHGGDKDFVELPDGRKRYFQVNVKY